jgi:hypothetical protein
MTLGSFSPWLCGLGGHQTVVPGKRSNTRTRARVVLHMPFKSESAMPIAALIRSAGLFGKRKTPPVLK